MTPEELTHAEVAGRWARENGRGIDTCPTWAPNELGRPWRERWLRGWSEEDRRQGVKQTKRGKR